MKTKVLLLVSIFIAGALFLQSCNKKKQEEEDIITKVSKPNDQQGTTEADAAVDDVNDFINNKIGGGSDKRVAAYNLPCGVVSVDSSTNNANGKKIYKFQYGSQTPCGYKYKSGDVNFELIKGEHFSDTGAVYKITFTNYTVEVKATGNTVTVNGFKTVTNKSGGFIWYTVVKSATIVHTMRGSLDITFSDGTIRNRKYFQKRTWSSNNGWAGLSLVADGDTSISGVNVSELGQTYDGNYNYQTEINTAFAWYNCGTTFAGPYVLKNGAAKMNVTVPNISPTFITVEAGYYRDINNLSVDPVKVNDCSSNCYKIDSQFGTSTKTDYQLY